MLEVLPPGSSKGEGVAMLLEHGRKRVSQYVASRVELEISLPRRLLKASIPTRQQRAVAMTLEILFLKHLKHPQRYSAIQKPHRI
jgi:hypothetical protein